jgi:hypothetical protein
MASAAYKYIYGDRYHPSVDEYFGDANVVMYPKTPELPKDRFAGLLIYYQPELEKRFVAVAESARWRMYRRKPQGN